MFHKIIVTIVFKFLISRLNKVHELSEAFFYSSLQTKVETELFNHVFTSNFSSDFEMIFYI